MYREGFSSNSVDETKNILDVPQRPPEVQKKYRKENVGKAAPDEENSILSRPQRPPAVQEKYARETVRPSAKQREARTADGETRTEPRTAKPEAGVSGQTQDETEQPPKHWASDREKILYYWPIDPAPKRPGPERKPTPPAAPASGPGYQKKSRWDEPTEKRQNRPAAASPRWNTPPPAESRTQTEMSPDELREKFHDPNYLPTIAELKKAFSSKDWKEWMYFCFPDEERAEDRKGYHVDYKKGREPVFEFYTEEYIDGLANYLQQRVEQYGATKDDPVIILEVGAGQGRLSHFLKQKLGETVGEKVKIIATDSKALGIPESFPVETAGHKEALIKHKPQIVISSWMPMSKDWTADFRAMPSVKEYILIGDPVITGQPWNSWGKKAGRYNHKTQEFEYPKGKIPNYERDGFIKSTREDLSSLQYCRTDEAPGLFDLKDFDGYHHSETTMFTRQP